MQQQQRSQKSGDGGSEEDPADDADSDRSGDADEVDARADELAAALGESREDPVDGSRVDILWDAKPQPGYDGEAAGAESEWAKASLEERLSAAGAAAAAADRPAVPSMATTDGKGHGSGLAGRGILLNPQGYP